MKKNKCLEWSCSRLWWKHASLNRKRLSQSHLKCAEGWQFTMHVMDGLRWGQISYVSLVFNAAHAIEGRLNKWMKPGMRGRKMGNEAVRESQKLKWENHKKEETSDKLHKVWSSADWQAKHHTSTSWGKAWLAFTNWNVIGDWGGWRGCPSNSHQSN